MIDSVRHIWHKEKKKDNNPESYKDQEQRDKKKKNCVHITTFSHEYFLHLYDFWYHCQTSGTPILSMSLWNLQTGAPAFIGCRSPVRVSETKEWRYSSLHSSMEKKSFGTIIYESSRWPRELLCIIHTWEVWMRERGGKESRITAKGWPMIRLWWEASQRPNNVSNRMRVLSRSPDKRTGSISETSIAYKRAIALCMNHTCN